MTKPKILFLAFFVLALNLHGAHSGITMDKYILGQWSFSSDHLPGAAKGQLGNDIFNIGFFNVLNENYKLWITKGQQLGGSDLDRMPEQERNQANVDIIKNDKISIWALQECSPPFIAMLKAQMNPRYKFSQVTKAENKDYGVVAYNSHEFELLSEAFVPYLKNGHAENYIQILEFKHLASGKKITFINTHAAFGATDQLRDYLLTLSGSIIAAGDMNVGFNDPRDESNFQKALWERLEPQGFEHIKFAYTHVNTLAVLDTFDHFLYKNIIVAANEELTAELRQKFSLKNNRQR